MKQLFSTLCLLMVALLASAQTARVQVIHNSPLPGTPDGPVVDIYVNDALLPQLTAVPFRAATPFLDVPAGVDITIDVKASPSTPADPAAGSFNLGQLDDGGTYVVSATGVLGSPSTPFGLSINAAAKEAAADPATVEFAVLHGSPDAPNVDVDARLVGNLISDLAFGSYSGYLPVPPALYYVDVRAAGSPGIVATFAADLSGLAGGAATVFASGFLGDTPSFGLFAALPNGTVVELPASPVARVQVIHNSPSPTVDVYANGDLLLGGFEFRTATPFIFLPAEVAIDLAVVPAGGDPATQNVYAGGPITLDNGATYVVTAGGIAGDATFPFTLQIQAAGQEASANAPNVDFTILHGSPGAPPVNISAVGVVTADLVDDLSYGQYTGYFSVPAAPYFIIVDALGLEIPFYADLSGLEGGAATVFASGLLTGDPAFGLFAALPDGTVVEIPAITEFANVQVIHNSPEPVVDVYINGSLAIADFEFRTATDFLQLPAGIPLSIGVAAAGSTSVNDTLVNFNLPGLDADVNYVVTAGGIVGDANFPFTLQILGNAQQISTDPANVDVVVLHGSPGAPAVDVDARLVGNLIEGLAYGEYSSYLPIPQGAYYLDVRASGSPDIVATYLADLDGLGGAAATVFASGILGGSPAFGLFAALPDGTVVELPLAPVARAQLIHNSPSPTVDIYANGDLLLGGFEFRTATPFIFLPAGTPIDLAVVPAGGDPATQNVYTGGPITLDNGATYVVSAGGIAGNPVFPFTLHVQPAGQEASTNAPNVDFTILHGSPGAPAVNVSTVGVVTADLVNDLSYGEFTSYFSVPAAPYFVILDVQGLEVPFYADLSGLEGGAATVFASGLLTGNPDFGLFAALPDGTVVELPLISEFANVQIIHNSPSPSVDVYLNGSLAIPDFEFRTATEFLAFPAGIPLNVGVAPAGSTSVTDTIASFDLPALDADVNYIVTAGGIVGDLTFPFSLQILANAQQAATDPGNVDVVVLHSSPGAPAVDVDARLVATLVQDLAYGEYSSYLPVPANDYFLDIRAAGSPDIVATFEAPLSLFEGESLTVFASGILGGTPAFGLFAADADGNVFELSPISIARFQLIHNAVAPSVDIYFNDELGLADFEFRTATGYDFVVAEEAINVKVVPAGGNPATDAVLDTDVTFPANAGSYVVVATGIPGNMDTPFTLAVYDGGREAAEAGGVDLLLYHGSPNAPAVDVLVSGTSNVVFGNVAYGEFSNDYVNVPAAVYELDVTPAGINDQVVATYLADVTSLDGGAAVVFASGLLGTEEPTFEAWVALPDGTTFPLELIVGTNDLNGLLESMTVFPNPISDRGYIRFELAQSTQLQYDLFDAQGRLMRSANLGMQPAGVNTIDIEAAQLPAGTYYARLRSSEGTAVRTVIVK